MSLYRQVCFNLEVSLRLYKWLIPVAVLALVGWAGVDRIALGVQTTGLAANAWDALFLILGDIYPLLIVVVLPFTFIVGDLFSDSAMNTHLLLRSASRQAWWLGKITTIVVLGVMYLALIVAGAAMMASAALRWEGRWSAYSASTDLNLATPTMLRDTPMSFFAFAVALIFLGLVVLGLTFSASTLALKSPSKAFLVTSAVVISGMMSHGYAFEPPLRDLFIARHLLPFYYVDSFQEMVLGSLGYWLFTGTALMLGGGWLARRQDFW